LPHPSLTPKATFPNPPSCLRGKGGVRGEGSEEGCEIWGEFWKGEQEGNIILLLTFIGKMIIKRI